MDLLTHISTLIRTPEPIPKHLAHLSFFSEESITLPKIWKIFAIPHVHKLIQKSCQSKFRKNKIIPLQDLITEVCINRIEYIIRTKGFPFPLAGSDPNYQWEGWFVLAFGNTCKSLIAKESSRMNVVSLDDLQTSYGITLAQTDSGESPESSLLTTENDEIFHLFNLDNYLQKSKMINPQMRLFSMLLHAPQNIEFSHFEACNSKIGSASNPFEGSLISIWAKWVAIRSGYIEAQKTDSEVLTTSRNALVLLLFGQNYSSVQEFINKDGMYFEKCKDRMRKTINRCTYLQHKARLSYILEHIQITDNPEFYLKLIKYDIVQGLILAKSQHYQLDQCAQLLISYSGEYHCHKTIGAIIHKSDSRLEQRIALANHITAKVSKALSADFQESQKIEQ